VVSPAHYVRLGTPRSTAGYGSGHVLSGDGEVAGGDEMGDASRGVVVHPRLAAHLHSEVTRIQDVVKPVVAFLVLLEVVS
jgi:hypothetical protein